MAFQDRDLASTKTDYGRIAEAKKLAGAAPQLNFSGKPWTDSRSNRTYELERGCGVYPRVWGDEDKRISEVPVTSRTSLRFGTTALAQLGGITPRQQAVDEPLAKLRRERAVWYQHDHEKSRCDRKELRPLRVAGMSSAHLGYTRQALMHRMGVDDRPHWMGEDEDKPGGWNFTPSDKNGDPTLFGRDASFSQSFPLGRGRK